MAAIAFLFPGQGSQVVGMGQDLFESLPEVRELFELADRISERPLSQLCFDGPLENLTMTENLQPALTAVDLACFLALTAQGVSPGAVAGHSLGEYPALAAAGVIGQADALELTALRGRLMQRDADLRPGAMSAIVGLTVEQVDRIVELAGAEGVVVAANYNSPAQVVISGEGAAVAAAAQYAKKEKGKAVPLPVSGAWHSPLMNDAAREFAEKLETISFSAPSVPVYLNVTGRPETDPAKIKDAMTRQIISPVRWAEAVAAMLDHQFDTFVEVGPKNVLGGLVKKTAPKDSGASVLTCGNLEEIEAAAGKIKAG